MGALIAMITPEASPSLSTARAARVGWHDARIAIGLSLGTILAALASLLVLTRYPPVFIDEPWYANAAWNIVTNGTNFDTMFAGVLDQWEEPWVRWPLLGNLPLAAAFAVGGLGLFQARLTSWIFGVVLLGLVFLLGRRLYGTTTGAVAALLLSVSAVFLQASHYARVDIFLACTLVAALHLLVVGMEERRLLPIFAAGVISSVSVDIHMNGALFAMSLAIVMIAMNGREVLRGPGRRSLLALAAGGLLGTIYWLLVHVAPSPGTYFEISRGWQGSMMLPPIATLSPAALIESARAEIGRYRFYTNGLEFALIGASLLFAAARRTTADRIVLTFFGAAFVLFVLFVQNKHDIYTILFYPLLLLLVAEVLVDLLRSERLTAHIRLFALGLLVLFVVNSALHIARPVYQSRDYNYDALTQRMRRSIPAGARVAGMPTWWLGFADYDYRSILSVTYYHLFNGYDLAQSLNAMRPRYLIVDTSLERLLVDDDAFSTKPGFGMYNLPRQDFVAFLEARGRRIDAFEDRWHGQLAVYEILWEAQEDAPDSR